MIVNTKKMEKAISLISNSVTRKILLDLSKNNMRFIDLEKSCHEEFGKTIGISYYISKLSSCDLIQCRRPELKWYLTHTGKLCTDLIKDFTTIYTEYYMEDCNSKGILKVKPKRNVRKR